MRELINTLISYLIAIKQFSKDIHYNCVGDDFYGKHLFADRIGENIEEYIDLLKEVCLLGHGVKTLASSRYLQMAIEFIPELGENMFAEMQQLILKTLAQIEFINKNASVGDLNLLGTIAQELQNMLGLINVQVGEINV